MKEIDDTDPTESESETRRETDELLFEAIKRLDEATTEAIRSLMLRVANLETQRTPEMENDDPEWFS